MAAEYPNSECDRKDSAKDHEHENQLIIADYCIDAVFEEESKAGSQWGGTRDEKTAKQTKHP
jgi:hypothetical protein